MSTKKSIFKRQVQLYLSILLLSFTLLAVVLTSFFNNYYLEKEKDKLIAQGEKLQKTLENLYRSVDVNTDKLNFELQVLENYMGARVFVINTFGQVLVVSSSIDIQWIGQTITVETIKDVFEGNIVTIEGKLGNLVKEKAILVGYPLSDGNNVTGAIFMFKPIPEIKKSVNSMMGIVIMCMILVMLGGIVLIFLFSKKITNPILQMNEAAKIIADGNFEKRIEISSEDEVGQLAESFNNMAASLDIFEQSRRNFIGSISHDLRSPLTSIQGFLVAIMDGTVPKEKESHYLSIIYEETQRLIKLTNDVVDLTTAESGKLGLKYSDFDINELIKDCMDIFEERFRQKEINALIVYDELQTIVNADPDKIKRVLLNLIDNALKFVSIGGKIKVETTITNNRIMISVSDNGSGISDRDKRNIFDRFFKGDVSRGEDKSGVGLGLSIVKEIIKAHNEQIEFKTEEDKGTEFIFSLSLSENN